MVLSFIFGLCSGAMLWPSWSPAAAAVALAGIGLLFLPAQMTWHHEIGLRRDTADYAFGFAIGLCLNILAAYLGYALGRLTARLRNKKGPPERA